jgi:uncharacterized iron-regulated membrane protein
LSRSGKRLHSLVLVMHRYAGLILGVPILILALTGCLLVFQESLDRFLNPHLLVVTPQDRRVSLQSLADRVRSTYPADTVQAIRTPSDPDRAAIASLRRDNAFVVAFLDPYTGEIKGERSNASLPMALINRLHTGHVAGRVGQTVVGAITVVTLLGVLSGLFLWWPRKILTLKRGTNWRRTNFDLHSVLGIFSSLVLLFTLLSGITLAWKAPIDRFLVRWIDGHEIQKPVRLESTPVEGGRPLTLDEAVAISDQALPGTRFIGINIPQDAKAAYSILRNFPEDKTGGGRSRVVVDQWSGKVLDVVNSRKLPLGTRIVNFADPTHVGIVLGLPTVILAFLGAAALAGQTVTGFLIWWKPRRGAGAQRSGTEEAA